MQVELTLSHKNDCLQVYAQIFEKNETFAWCVTWGTLLFVQNAANKPNAILANFIFVAYTLCAHTHTRALTAYEHKLLHNTFS